MIKYYIVDYDYMVGEFGIPKQKLMSTDTGESFDEILDSYFLDFFGNGTRKDGKRYYDRYDEQCIAITSWLEVPLEHALILDKYLH